MTRRKTFDPAAVPISFWRRDEVQVALARRDIARLLKLYLSGFPECTQMQLALLTAHDRSDISNFVRGTRDRPVSDIDVLARIADGLELPDEARVLLGLAPADAAMSSISRAPARARDGDGPLAGRDDPDPQTDGWRGRLRRFWKLAPRSRVDIVCSEIPEGERPYFASPRDRNYLRYARFADLDSLIYVRTHLAELSPDTYVRDFAPPSTTAAIPTRSSRALVALATLATSPIWSAATTSSSSTRLAVWVASPTPRISGSQARCWSWFATTATSSRSPSTTPSAMRLQWRRPSGSPRHRSGDPKDRCR